MLSIPRAFNWSITGAKLLLCISGTVNLDNFKKSSSEKKIIVKFKKIRNCITVIYNEEQKWGNEASQQKFFSQEQNLQWTLKSEDNSLLRIKRVILLVNTYYFTFSDVKFLKKLAHFKSMFKIMSDFFLLRFFHFKWFLNDCNISLWFGSITSLILNHNDFADVQ